MKEPSNRIIIISRRQQRRLRLPLINMAPGPSTPEAINERAALRSAIKREFQKQISNPHRHASGEGGHLVCIYICVFVYMCTCMYVSVYVYVFSLTYLYRIFVFVVNIVMCTLL